MTAQNSRLSEFLPYLLAVTATTVSDRIAETYRARFGIRIPEWRGLGGGGGGGAPTPPERLPGPPPVISFGPP